MRGIMLRDYLNGGVVELEKGREVEIEGGETNIVKSVFVRYDKFVKEDKTGVTVKPTRRMVWRKDIQVLE